jgi:hypothetical protein
MKEIESLISGIGELDSINPAMPFTRTLNRLKKLKDDKISGRDLQYMETLSGLFAKREEMTGSRWTTRASGGIIAGIALAILRVTFGATGVFNDREWAFASFMLLVVSGIFFAAISGFLTNLINRMFDNSQMRRFDPILFVMIGVFLAIVRIWSAIRPPWFIHAAGLCFPLSGAPLGGAIAHSHTTHGLKKNLTDIAEACDNYVLNVDDDF